MMKQKVLNLVQLKMLSLFFDPNTLPQLYFQICWHCALDLLGFCGYLTKVFDYFLELNPRRQSFLSI